MTLDISTDAPHRASMIDNSDLAALIRTIPDYPKPGILFRDVTTLLLDGPGFKKAIDRLAARVDFSAIDLIAGVEARGFIVAAALCHAQGKGMIPLRKPGKLPGKVAAQDYQLEYGTDRIELHKDAIMPGQHVLLVDDLIATGGTALAAITLLRNEGAVVTQALFLVDLPDLGGAELLTSVGVTPQALIAFAGA
jgi:adenine phosphoribosyltransferase